MHNIIMCEMGKIGCQRKNDNGIQSKCDNGLNLFAAVGTYLPVTACPESVIV